MMTLMTARIPGNLRSCVYGEQNINNNKMHTSTEHPATAWTAREKRSEYRKEGARSKIKS